MFDFTTFVTPEDRNGRLLGDIFALCDERLDYFRQTKL